MSLISEGFYKKTEDDWQQGDIVLDVNLSGEKVALAVLATPQCDIYQDKADFYLFVLNADFKDTFKRIVDPEGNLNEEHLRGIVQLSKNKLSSIISHIIQHLNGANANRFYYLPPSTNYFIELGPNYLDFQRIITVPKDTLNKWKEKRGVTIADPFRAQILSRYMSYVGRIGTPAYGDEEIYRIISSSGLEFRPEDFEDIYKKKVQKGR